MLQQIADGRTDLVFEYVSQGNSASCRGDDGVSLMQWCAYHGDVSAIRFLISRGASLQELGPNLDLNGAVFHGHKELCEFLIEQGADVNHPMPETGETPLHSALCKTDNRTFNPVLKVLLTHGANPHVTTIPGIETDSFMRDCRTKGETPLHRAAAFGDAEAIQMLLDAGANKEARDAFGDTPLSWASWYLRPRPILRMLCYGSYSVRG